jgi:hypothetical protein
MAAEICSLLNDEHLYLTKLMGGGLISVNQSKRLKQDDNVTKYWLGLSSHCHCRVADARDSNFVHV